MYDQQRLLMRAQILIVHGLVLYDLDIEAKAHAEKHGLAFDRTACVNDDSEVMRALARRVTAISA